MISFSGSSYNHPSGFAERSKPSRALPSGPLIVLGETSLSGIFSGSIALEVLRGSEKNVSTRIWTRHERHGHSWGLSSTISSTESKSGKPGHFYSRLCVNTPADTPENPPMTYWVDPDDGLTQCAGLGSQWLELLDGREHEGLVLARLDTLMLGLDSLQKLQAWGLLTKPIHH